MNGIYAWFAKNSVAVNLLMGTIVVAGLITAFSMKMEVFPEFEVDLITISVNYLGAAPAEVEEGVCVKIEEAVQDMEGIKKLSSTASEGVGAVAIEVIPGYDTRDLMDDIKTRVDAIDTFPEETEKPVIHDIVSRRQVIGIAVSGRTNETVLKKRAEEIREDLLAFPAISQVELAGTRPCEISIEVSEEALRRYGLTFDEAVGALRRSSLDVPGGSVKTSGGEILLRSKGQAYRSPEFESLVLRSRADGTRLLLGDVAHVEDGFAETDHWSRFDGAPALLIQVFRVGDESALEIADTVKSYVRRKQKTLPEGLVLTPWQDEARTLRSRLDLMLRNGGMGSVLVFLALALFLRLRLAFWVTAGTAISFLGALWLMPAFDVSINLMSLFAFIVVLGIVVDDAIVVGENIHVQQQHESDPLKAAISGVREVSKPVIFAVLTTLAAFLPLLTVEGVFGKFMRALPIIVILALSFSLTESLFILPAHLRHGQPRPKNHGPGYQVRRVQDFVTRRLERFIENVYSPALEWALAWRYMAVALAVATLVLTLGFIGAGWVEFIFFPDVDADNVVAMLTMPQGTPAEGTAAAVRRLEETALRLRKELHEEGIAQRPDDDPEVVRHIMASVGEQPFRTRQSWFSGNLKAPFSAAHLGEVNLELSLSEVRTISSAEIANRWREMTGPIVDAVELTYSSSFLNAGEPINIELSSNDYKGLQDAAEEIKIKLARYPGVFDISDSFRGGKQEIKLDVTPLAQAQGVSLADLARQVRQAFYGAEAQRIQRGRDDIRVMVRYPESRRRSLGDLENMRVRLPDGAEVPFSIAARAEFGRGYSSIQRVDRRRVIDVTANIDETRANANEILSDLKRRFMPAFLADHPGVSYTLEGEQRQQRETMDSLLRGFMIAILAIYALLAIPFRSYTQPLIVMSAIPFGIVGAVWGHIIMGLDLTLLSIFGIVALTGVVVNDSLVLVDFVNRGRASGKPLQRVIRTAGAARFRAVLLTSLTTFAGLTPLLLEKSLQAQFLIPMAVSLGFGVVFSTAITLLLVPVGYLILEDIKA